MTKSKLIFYFLVCTLLLLSSTSHSQGLKYSIRVSYVKFDVSKEQKVVLFPHDYYNGYEIGLVAIHNLDSSFLNVSVGLLYEELRYSSYNLNFISIPFGLDLVFGKKAGVLFGAGIKLMYLSNIPAEPGYPGINSERFNYSLTARMGLFFTLDKIKIQLFPQIESIQNPLYMDNYDHYINRVSYTMAIIF